MSAAEALIAAGGAPPGAEPAGIKKPQTPSQERAPLRTQAEVDAYLAANVKIGECIQITLAPSEQIDLSTWIGPWECCSHCGTATPGLRLDAEGHPREDCKACGEGGFLITCWGEAQKNRWEDDERYERSDGLDDDGPQVGPIVVVGGDKRHARNLRSQADRALVRFSQRMARAT